MGSRDPFISIRSDYTQRQLTLLVSILESGKQSCMVRLVASLLFLYYIKMTLRRMSWTSPNDEKNGSRRCNPSRVNRL